MKPSMFLYFVCLLLGVTPIYAKNALLADAKEEAESKLATTPSESESHENPVQRQPDSKKDCDPSEGDEARCGNDKKDVDVESDEEKEPSDESDTTNNGSESTEEE